MSLSEPAGAARIYEGGYRRYDGARRGAQHSFASLWRHTIERILGLRRPARTKVLPVLTILISHLPPAVFIGLAAFLPDQLAEATLPDYADIYGFITLAVTLFVVFVAPEALCPDRRYGVLSLYLASPLRRDTYLLAKAAAVFSVLMFVTLSPPLLLLIGLTLQSQGPDGIVDLALTLGRIVLAGVVTSGVYTAVSVGVASFTDRKAWAAAVTFIFMTAATVLAGILVFQLGAPDEAILLGVTQIPPLLVERIFAVDNPDTDVNIATAAAAIGAVAWTAAGAGVAWWRYRKLQVTR